MKKKHLQRINKAIIITLIVGEILLAKKYLFISEDELEKSQSKEIKALSLVNATAMDNIKTDIKFISNGEYIKDFSGDIFTKIKDKSAAKLNCYVPIDINGDGQSDCNLFILTDSKFGKKQALALSQIQKGSNLVLEGTIEKNENGKITGIQNSANLKKASPHAIIPSFDFTIRKNPGYIDIDNLISIDNCVVTYPKSIKNKRIFKNQLANNGR